MEGLIAVPYLKAWRLSQGKTQLELAITAKVGEHTVIRMEKGAPAREVTIARLARGLGISMRQLLNELPPESDAA